jgi:hypothetical protein
VTVSFAHFIKNLPGTESQSRASIRSLARDSSACAITRPIVKERLPDELHSADIFGFVPPGRCEVAVVDFATG